MPPLEKDTVDSFKLKSAIEMGAVSSVQLEAILHCKQRWTRQLPRGLRGGFFLGDGTVGGSSLPLNYPFYLFHCREAVKAECVPLFVSMPGGYLGGVIVIWFVIFTIYRVVSGGLSGLV